MPTHKLPNGFPEPDSLIRDPKWNEGYPSGWPEMFLRSVYDIMESEFRAGRGTRGAPRIAFIKAFNVTTMSMVRKTRPRRAALKDGKLELTPYGVGLNLMYAGKKKVVGPPTSYIMKRYGKTGSADMKLEYNRKMRKLAILIEILKPTLPDNTPDLAPTRIP
jgi:hypothetical protein